MTWMIQLKLFWASLGWPLLKLLFSISLGLLVANFIEALNWTQGVAKLAKPLLRLGHLSDTAGASFSMAFVSGVTSNTILSEAYAEKKIGRLELQLANLFNTLPTYFAHLPTVFFITAPMIKSAAFYYVGITLVAALLRTGVVLALSRLLLPAPSVLGGSGGAAAAPLPRRLDWRLALRKSWTRFQKKIHKLVLYTAPIYTLMHFLHKFGMFKEVDSFIARHLTLLTWLNPQSVGIVVFHVAAEFTAGLAAAGALVQAGSLSSREVVLALLVGNVLASPMRAIRHQFPYYAGIFSPGLALQLIVNSQIFRAVSVILVGVGYYWFSA